MAVTLVTGGARSGKSRHAEQLVHGATPVTYLATGRPADRRTLQTPSGRPGWPGTGRGARRRGAPSRASTSLPPCRRLLKPCLSTASAPG